MSIKVILQDVTFSYAHVFKPKESQDPGGAPKYSVCVLIDKGNAADLARVQSAIDGALAEGVTKFPGKYNTNLPTFKKPLRDGDLEKPDDEAYKNKMFFNCSAAEDKKPEVINKAMQPIGPNEFYSGCIGRISVAFYPFSGRAAGVAVGLNHIQKTADGVRIAGGTSAAQDFGTAGEDFGSDDSAGLM